MRSLKPVQSAKPTVKITTEDPELASRFNRVLEDTVEAMEESGLRYVFIGGIASSGLGRPRSTHDIDLFVMPEDAELALRALAKKGFQIEKTDPSWLYKGFKEDILVDVIFKSKGEIYLDSEMYGRVITAEFHGKRLKFVAPEDLLIIKAVAHSELTPNHWHDATALLSHANLDWDYLIKRARRAPRRILSLLLYAQSNDIWVPNFAIHELYQGIFGDRQPHHTPPVKIRSTTSSTPRISSLSPESRGETSAGVTYAVAHLRDLFAEDSRINELDIQVERFQDRILLRGEVPVAERRDAVEKITQEKFPGYTIENQIRVLNCTEAAEVEDMK